MGWLRKSRQRDEEVEQVESDKLEKEEKEIPLAYGPRDWADADEDEDLVDMGAIRLPAIEGMQVTLIPSTGTELDTVVAAWEVQALSCVPLQRRVAANFGRRCAKT